MFPIARPIFLVAVLAACPVLSRAQDGTVRGPDGAAIGVMTGQVGGAPMRQGMQGPVSVTLERKTVQTLADGTHITRVTHEVYIRDSKGRTRSETEFGPSPGTEVQSHNVVVNDPVSGINYSWQTGMPGGRKVYTMRQRRVPAANPVPRPNSNPLMRTLPGAANGMQAKTPADVTTETLGSGGSAHAASAAAPAPPPPQAVVPATPQGPVLRPEMTRDALGQRIIGGLTCMAQRTTAVYPVNYFGNDRPITTMDETCVSQDAGRVIEETREDPRTGVQTVTLLSGSLEEPDASLFLPPPDYTEQQPGAPRQQP